VGVHLFACHLGSLAKDVVEGGLGSCGQIFSLNLVTSRLLVLRLLGGQRLLGSLDLAFKVHGVLLKAVCMLLQCRQLLQLALDKGQRAAGPQRQPAGRVRCPQVPLLWVDLLTRRGGGLREDTVQRLLGNCSKSLCFLGVLLKGSKIVQLCLRQW